jgi:hypothetical protein
MERARLDQRAAEKGSALGYDDIVADLNHMVGSGVL